MNSPEEAEKCNAARKLAVNLYNALRSDKELAVKIPDAANTAADDQETGGLDISENPTVQSAELNNFLLKHYGIEDSKFIINIFTALRDDEGNKMLIVANCNDDNGQPTVRTVSLEPPDTQVTRSFTFSTIGKLSDEDKVDLKEILEVVLEKLGVSTDLPIASFGTESENADNSDNKNTPSSQKPKSWTDMQARTAYSDSTKSPPHGQNFIAYS